MVDYIKKFAQNIEPINLQELNEYKLLNRIDTKYICNISIIPKILEYSDKNFRIQSSGSRRVFPYESLYFDTPELKTYFDHHRGKRIRYKIRFRKYLDSGDSFLEIKKKKNYSRTNKERQAFDFSNVLQNEHIDFINEQLDISGEILNPNIWTIFDRITLAGKNQIERITIDTNLRFKNKHQVVSMPHISIIELKREKVARYSTFEKILDEFNIKPFGISKYVLGNILLNPYIKHNRFKRKLKNINKISYDTKYI